MDFKIDIPFGAHDSELKGWEYTIPEGMEAIIKDGKVIVREKESEDERIRRQLINVCNDYLNGDYSAKPCLKDIRRLKNLLENQKEQKLTWSENDKQWLSEVYFTIDHSMYSVDERQAMKKYIDFLRSQSKSAEWSDDIIRKAVKEVGLTQHQIDWFKTNVFPPKQEWSEEDENNLNKLLQWDGIPLGLRSWVSGLPEKVGTRPSWKPSEEQMKALIDCAIGNEYDVHALVRLWAELKKL